MHTGAHVLCAHVMSSIRPLGVDLYIYTQSVHGLFVCIAIKAKVQVRHIPVMYQ